MGKGRRAHKTVEKSSLGHTRPDVRLTSESFSCVCLVLFLLRRLLDRTCFEIAPAVTLQSRFHNERSIEPLRRREMFYCVRLRFADISLASFREDSSLLKESRFLSRWILFNFSVQQPNCFKCHLESTRSHTVLC